MQRLAALVALSVFFVSCFSSKKSAHPEKPGANSADKSAHPEKPGANSADSCTTWKRPFSVDARFFPFDSKCVELTHGRIHYFDVSPKNSEAKGTVLAFHGNPLWSVIFTRTAQQAVDAGYRFIALDYYGYGMSDKPDPNKFDYLISSQSRMAAEFMRKLDLKDLTIMVQDGGGPIGLGAAQQEPDRVKNLVVINTWFTETQPIAPGTTTENFIFHDWSNDNILNEAYFVGTGYNAFNGAKGTLSAWGIDPKSQEGESLRRMMLSPYFENGDTTKPLSATVHLPHVRLVQSVLSDREHFRSLERNMKLLASKPAYFLFADPLAFSALRCDVGPRSRIDMTSADALKFGAKQLEGNRALCPVGYTCSDNPAKPFQSKCLDSAGNEYWPRLQKFLDVWTPGKVVGIYKNYPAHEYLSAKEPEAIVEGLTKLSAFVK